MKLKMQLDLGEIFITPDANEIKVNIPIYQGCPSKHGFVEKQLEFKTGFVLFLKKDCALDIYRQLKKALNILENGIQKQEEDDLDQR